MMEGGTVPRRAADNVARPLGMIRTRIRPVATSEEARAMPARRVTRACCLVGLLAAIFVHPARALERGGGTVCQSARQIPVIASVDVVIVGGTVAGVAAAESAAAEGANVFLVASRTYLGEDLCATLRLQLSETRRLGTDLEKRLFPDGSTTTPAHVKSTLASVLVDAGVKFTYASYVTDVLRDDEAKPCGVVIANRAGRQAVVAKVLVDATDHAWACRRAGCPAAPWPGGTVHFEQRVLQLHGNDAYGRSPRRRSDAVNFTIHADEFDLDMPDLSYASFAAARQAVRDSTFAHDLLRMAETLFCVPPTRILCRKSHNNTTNELLDIGHFQPRTEDRLYVLSGWADVSRRAAAELLRPAAIAGIAADVGRAAATEAAPLADPPGAHVPSRPADAMTQGDVRELLAGARPTDTGLPTVPSGGDGLPVFAKVDVLVIGGGTAGAPAAIAAARRGARTLVVEYQEGLGGVGTVGIIGRPYHGRNVGFAKEVPYPDNIEQKMEWYRTELTKAGGTVWFGALGAGAFVQGSAVKGAVVCTPEGRGVVLAKVVVDATGNGDVAISAGADYMYGTLERGDIALQGTGLPGRTPGRAYTNTDYMLVDESDMIDLWRALVCVHLKPPKAHDIGTLIQNRERRRVVGDFVMRYVDAIAARTYPDSIVHSRSDYDSHGYPSFVFFYLLPHDDASRKAKHPAPGGSCYTPYRCLLPRGLDGILVAGLAISMDRDVTAMVRMQRDMANQGYAAGTAAAMAAQAGAAPRDIDVHNLQRHLVEIGCLPEEVLAHDDSFPLPASDVQHAVAEFGKATNPRGAARPLAVILTHRDAAVPLLQKAYARAHGRSKLLYAQVLGVFGDKHVVPTLLAALDEVREWDAKILQGAMADHAYLPTPVDSIILALGYAGDRGATPAILRMVALLDARVTLSHHRTVALALERLRDPDAARPLAELLQKPGMRGFAMTAAPAIGRRTGGIREICLARALYRCGDYRGLGKEILEEYRRDMRGLFARHATAVLSEE